MRRNVMMILLVLGCVLFMASCTSGGSGEVSDSPDSPDSTDVADPADSGIGDTERIPMEVSEDVIPTGEAFLEEGAAKDETINLGNDSIASLIKVVGVRQTAPAVLYGGYPEDMISLIVVYSADTDIFARAKADTERYVGYLMETERFLCSAPDGEPTIDDGKMYTLEKDSVDADMALNVTVAYTSEGCTVTMTKSPKEMTIRP